ncbi:3850_t:CDS:2, partial [Diversispora eburnea]
MSLHSINQHDELTYQPINIHDATTREILLPQKLLLNPKPISSKSITFLENIKAKKSIDVFSLGSILYYLCTKKLLYDNIEELEKLVREKKKKIRKKIGKTREDYNIEITIPIWTETSDENKNWLKEVKKMHHTLHKIFDAEIKEANYKKIKEQIIKRNKNFLDNKKIVIQSLLNKERPRIVTDSLTRITNKQIEVITDPEEIKQEIKNVFSHWITPKNIEDLNQYQEWKQTYNQNNEIREE